MIVLIAKYYTRPGQAEAVLSILEQMSALVKIHEPGCKLYQVCRSRENPDLLLLYEQYVDQTAVDAHRATAHFQMYILDTIIPMLAKREVEFFNLVLS